MGLGFDPAYPMRSREGPPTVLARMLELLAVEELARLIGGEAPKPTLHEPTGPRSGPGLKGRASQVA